MGGRDAARAQSLAAGVREHGHVPRSGNFVPKRGTGTSWNIVPKCSGTRIIYIGAIIGTSVPSDYGTSWCVCILRRARP